jgi:replicative DNA helicase
MDSLTLPFNDTKQAALLGHMIIVPKFFRNSYKKIKPSWFLSEKHARIYKTLISFYETYGVHPSLWEFKSYRAFLALDVKDREVLYAFMDDAVAGTGIFKLPALTVDLTNWLHSVILLEALKDSERLFNNHSIKECHSRLMLAVNEVNSSKFNNEDEVLFSAFSDYLKKAELERAGALTTGLSILDACLLDGATNGCLLKGDTTIFEAPLNGGKTGSLITIAINNVKRCKSVLLMSHEDRPEDIQLKILACYMDVPIVGLFELYKTEEGCKRLEQASKQIEKYLKYIPYNKAGKMIVEEVIPLIRIAHEDRMANDGGKGFDLLVVDYPAVLTTELAYKGSLQKRNIDDIVYENYIQLALEYKFHSLLAIQTNREGSRINKGQNRERRILTVEDVQESFGPLQRVSNVLTLNRPPEYEDADFMILGVAKCRSNKKNTAILAKTRFRNCLAFSNDLGGYAWAGSKVPDNLSQLEKILKECNGLFLDPEKTRAYGLS